MSNVLTPLLPVIVWCCQYPILVVRLPDDRLAATLHSFCEALNLNRSGQLQRIRRNWALAHQLLLVPVMTKSGPQHMDVLVIDAIPAWLAGIQVSRLAPEKRALAYELQEKARATILSQFPQSDTSATAHASAPEQPEAPARSAWDRLLAALDETKQALVALREEEQAERARLEQRLLEQERRVADLKEWFTSLDRQVALLGQRQQEPTLSATHLSDLKAIFRDLEQATKRTQAQAEAELSTLFKVEAVTAIPDTFWPEVLAWYAWSATRS